MFERYLERTRWFSGKGRPFEIASVRRIGEVPHAERRGSARRHRPGRGRRTATARAAARSTRCRWRSTPTPRPGSTTPSSAGGRSPGTAGCTPTTRCTTASAMRLLAAGLRHRRTRARRQPQRPQRAALPPAARPRARPGDALDAVLGRAVELLGRLRRGRADEGVPQDHAGRQPRHQRPRRAHPHRLRPHRGALRLAGLGRRGRGRWRRHDDAAGHAPGVPAHRQ